jgi:hypothetical protein
MNTVAVQNTIASAATLQADLYPSVFGIAPFTSPSKGGEIKNREWCTHYFDLAPVAQLSGC